MKCSLKVPKHEIFDPKMFGLFNFISKYRVRRVGDNKDFAPKVFFQLATSILKMLATTEYVQAPCKRLLSMRLHVASDYSVCTSTMLAITQYALSPC